MTRGRPSEAEIAVLAALAAQAELLTAAPGAGAPAFRAPILFVDPSRQFLVLGRSGDAAADAALLSRQGAELVVEWGEWRITFLADGPEPCTHEGLGAIRLRFPESVSINRRRKHERATVPASKPAHCVAYSGASPVFDALIVDVSRGGIGIQLAAGEDALEPGMILPRCRLEVAGSEPAIVDLEVRHTATSMLPDGRRVTRAGCRFVDLSADAEELVAKLAGA